MESEIGWENEEFFNDQLLDNLQTIEEQYYSSQVVIGPTAHHSESLLTLQPGAESPTNYSTPACLLYRTADPAVTAMRKDYLGAFNSAPTIY
ncbi:hypothetical protein J6590_065117 [Homalodisca vitripennis]|nr:hypothetical protein J6590_065117 [Homalodisca vitripennis]